VKNEINEYIRHFVEFVSCTCACNVNSHWPNNSFAACSHLCATGGT